MASSSCFVCPGHAAVWVAIPDDQNDYVPETWYKLPHTVSWGLVPDIEEATEIRTSDTAGKKVAPCGGATSWSLDVTSALCEDDWLYGYILGEDDRTDPANGADLWMFLAFEEGDTPGESITWDGSTHHVSLNEDNGIYLRANVNPPGFGFDNDSSDPVTAEWSADITWGPEFPTMDVGSGLGDTGTDP